MVGETKLPLPQPVSKFWLVFASVNVNYTNRCFLDKNNFEKNSTVTLQFYGQNSGTGISLVSRHYLRCC